jgi:hypothetical protein
MRALADRFTPGKDWVPGSLVLLQGFGGCCRPWEAGSRTDPTDISGQRSLWQEKYSNSAFLTRTQGAGTEMASMLVPVRRMRAHNDINLGGSSFRELCVIREGTVFQLLPLCRALRRT